jgi:cystathionine beta-synthase
MSENHARPYDNVTEVVGGTPLIRLNSVTQGVPGTIYAKCEFMNPGGSVKDRIGLAIVEKAEREGTLKPGGTIVEATSGNTGVALAMVAAIRGYRCIFTMPDKMSQEKVKLLRSFGADVVIVPTAVPPDHPDHYTQRAASIAKETPGAVLADQFYNPANAEAHYETTGPEVWEQTDGKVTHFLAGTGTGGTITGVGRFLKERNTDVQIIGVDPVGSILKTFFDTGEMTEGEPTRWRAWGATRFRARST